MNMSDMTLPACAMQQLTRVVLTGQGIHCRAHSFIEESGGGSIQDEDLLPACHRQGQGG
jgi:hypothetical protein